MSAVRALGWTAGARPGAGPWLVTAVAAGLGTATLSAITCMYRDRQETRRTEIEQRRTEILATAFARALDATHTKAQNLSGAKEMTEAARVRDSARQVTAILAPALITRFQALPAAARDRPEAANYRPAPAGAISAGDDDAAGDRAGIEQVHQRGAAASTARWLT